MSGESRIAITLPARDFIRDWRRYNLVANYVAEYASYFFEHKDRAENVISSVFYELLEHTATISREEADLVMHLVKRDDRVLIEIATHASPEAVGPHQTLLSNLAKKEIAGYYREILESDPAVNEGHRDLGLVMLVHDYNAELSTRVDTDGAITLSASIGQEEMNP
jgi:hypothetical protein